MEDLRHLITENRLITDKLVVGIEYFIPTIHITGIFLGKTYNNYFIVTHKRENEPWSRDSAYRAEYGYDVVVDGVSLHSQFLPLYNKLKNRIANLRDLPVREVSRNYMAIPISTNVLEESPVQKALFSPHLLKIIKSILVDKSKTSSDYKIAKHILSKLPVTLCELNDTGIAHVIADDRDVQVFTLNREKVIKSINKWCRMVRDERLQFNDVMFNLVVKNLEQTKIGRYIKKLTGSLFPDDQIESFVNTFSAIVRDNNMFKIEIVTGANINKWYDQKTYTPDGRGTLHNSCMRQAENVRQWNYYAIHPDCSMVIITISNKLYARALLWTLIDGTQYLDRIYYTDPIEKQILLRWANQRGITETYDDRIRATKRFYVINSNFEAIRDNKEINIPYFDTFRCSSFTLKYLKKSYENRREVQKIPKTFEEKLTHDGFYEVPRAHDVIGVEAHFNVFLENVYGSSIRRTSFKDDNDILAIDSKKNQWTVAKIEDCVWDSVRAKIITKPKESQVEKQPEVIQQEISFNPNDFEVTLVRRPEPEMNIQWTTLARPILGREHFIATDDAFTITATASTLVFGQPGNYTAPDPQPEINQDQDMGF